MCERICIARFQSRVLFDLLHMFQFLLVLTRSDVPEFSVVTFNCHVNEET